jgi:hypothetical protein
MQQIFRSDRSFFLESLLMLELNKTPTKITMKHASRCRCCSHDRNNAFLSFLFIEDVCFLIRRIRGPRVRQVPIAGVLTRSRALLRAEDWKSQRK